MIFIDVRKELFNLKNEQYKKFTEKLNPGVNNIIGVSLPVLRKIVNQIYKDNYKSYLSYSGNMYFEEIMIQGLLISKLKVDVDNLKKCINWYLPKIDNWAVCDTFCSSLKIVRNYKNELYSFFEDLLKSDNEFYVRFVLVIFLNYYIEEEYLDRIFENVVKINKDKYYVMMSAAWLISKCFIKYEKKTLSFLKCGKLDKITYNKALQKIIESNKVSAEVKKTIKNMKIYKK